ncbi:hypothetical protein [Sediminicola luteus]|uniref:Adhesin domain-containing protein n=1 Tax=Sediminicola luteus TaxID=319238 RepID=A0A2A4GAC1_9FLAO|nr:hypothetical protein [Sediminicola luteus]PCE64924.1 hypothetical protein B7P33_07110 [Sediminicola luteus]
MRTSSKILYSVVILWASIPLLYGQKQERTITETFDVNGDAIVDVNTQNADITFETWNKNQVKVEAKVILEDMEVEEADAYLKSNPVEIMGNSKKISIETVNQGHWAGNTEFNFVMPDVPELSFMPDIEFHMENFVMPEMPEMPEMTELLELPEIIQIPPMPHMGMSEFDYERYKKEGDSYMEEWQKEMKKYLDTEYKAELEQWKEESKIHREEYKKQREEIIKERKRAQAEMVKERKAIQKEMAQARAQQAVEQRRARAEVRQAQREVERQMQEAERQVRQAIRSSSKTGFAYSFGNNKVVMGGHASNHVKIHIKVWMPKSVRLKINARYGEIKLAQNTKNIEAKLAHSKLLARTIDGEDTYVVASYTPVQVEVWDAGKLKTDFSEKVELAKVGELSLDCQSSEVTIDEIGKKALINNALGNVTILAVGNQFSALDVNVENGELLCEMPQNAQLYINGLQSEIEYPSTWKLQRNEASGGVVHKGSLGKSGGKVNINAEYSEVVLR